MDQEVSGEITVLPVSPRSETKHSARATEPVGQLFVRSCTRTAGDQQPEARRRWQNADRVQQGFQPFKPIVHCHKQGDGLFGTNGPPLPPFLAATRAIRLSKTYGIDGAADNVDVPAGAAVMAFEAAPHHFTVHDDHRSRSAQILATFESGERSVGDVELLDRTGEGTRQRAAVLQEIVVCTGQVQAALRVEYVLTPGLVEPNRHLMVPV